MQFASASIASPVHPSSSLVPSNSVPRRSRHSSHRALPYLVHRSHQPATLPTFANPRSVSRRSATHPHTAAHTRQDFNPAKFAPSESTPYALLFSQTLSFDNHTKTGVWRPQLQLGLRAKKNRSRLLQRPMYPPTPLLSISFAKLAGSIASPANRPPASNPARGDSGGKEQLGWQRRGSKAAPESRALLPPMSGKQRRRVAGPAGLEL